MSRKIAKKGCFKYATKQWRPKKQNQMEAVLASRRHPWEKKLTFTLSFALLLVFLPSRLESEPLELVILIERLFRLFHFVR